MTNAAKPHRFEIEHLSEFRYTAPARGSVMALRLRPREDRGQRVAAFDLAIDPPAAVSQAEDWFGNACHLFNIHRTHGGTSIRSAARVETAAAPDLPDRLGPDGWDALAEAADPVACWEYLRPSAFAYPCPALDAFAAARGIGRGADPLETMLEAGRALYRAFAYAPGSTDADSPIERILETGRGVCQDYTHVTIALARSWGIPARYVSGYLHLEGVAGEQTPDGASHAWAECLLPGVGWLGIDPTNDTLADHRHVRVAIGRDYADACPTRGVVTGGGETELRVRVAVVGEGEPMPLGAPHAEPVNLPGFAPRPESGPKARLHGSDQ